ncbi:hypothetical protein E4U60_006181 [Claviceps pazoutovae]|uniref:Uncharacterized protein n=1 Tax=Claviceps pazoutovae TaxID=1649127 RepID=A0A9P7SJW2_9HYPO|nr:hypothetical protein E4U60_006181 [Claviceps pazoutovae]
MAVRYDELDHAKDISVVMIYNIFVWLRETDGWPVAERGIRDWLDYSWTSDDECAVAEDDDVDYIPATCRSVAIPGSNNAIAYDLRLGGPGRADLD